MSAATQIRAAELAPGVVLGPDGRIAVVEKDSSPRPFDPGKPPEPRVARGAPPRQWVPGISDNLGMAPRTERGRRLTPFETLKSLRSFDLVNVAVEDLRGQILGMEWDIIPRRQYLKEAKQLEPVIDEARRWIELPDPGDDIDFETFVGKVIDEMVTTDALSIWPAVDVMDRAIGMWLLDGSTIKPVRDILGRKPQPPDAAYYQYIHGQVETVFELPQLWYLPKNQQSASSYGYPPVEMLSLTINTAIRQDIDDLEYHRSGTVPSSLYACPPEWTPAQVKDFGEWWRRALQGDIEARHLMQFLPGGGTYIATKNRAWIYDYVEWMARKICAIFGVSPAPLVQVMNRATSDTLETSAMESGVRPYARFIARLFSRFLQRHLSRLNPQMAKLRFQYGEDETEAAADVRARQEMLVRNGAKTVNELRVANGDDKYDDIPAADRPFVNMGSSLVFLDEIGIAKPPEAAKPEPAPSNDQAPPDQGSDLQAALADLKRWRAVALKCVAADQPVRPFRSAAIPASVQRLVITGLDWAATAAEVQKAFERPLAICETAISRRAKARSQRSISPGDSSSASLSVGSGA